MPVGQFTGLTLSLMDLLGGYGSDSSDSSSSNDEKEKRVNPIPITKRQKSVLVLPSAADAFDSVKSASFMAPIIAKSEPELTKMPKQTTEPAPRSNAQLLPPQLSRPNVSTEDAERWSTAKSGHARKEGKGGQKVETHNTKEKRKRAEGKVAREGSFVEEEKRLLRQSGAD